MRILSTPTSATGYWDGEYDERALHRWAVQLRSRLRAEAVSLGLVFMGPRLMDQAAQVMEIIRVHARVPLLAGCSGKGLILGNEELEGGGGVVVGLYALPGAKLRAVHVVQRQVAECSGPGYWAEETGVKPGATNGWLAFGDPYTFDGERWLAGWSEEYGSLPTLGGLASGEGQEQRTQVYLNGEVHNEGAVVVSVGGAVEVEGVVSQACTPIGEPWTITKVEGNLIHQIGNRPAYQVLADTFGRLPKDQQERARGNLFVGLVTNEYKEEFHRGDFLIRSLLGGDPKTGVLAVGARPRAGQSVQFQCRDAASATEDLTGLLEGARRKGGGGRILGACLCSCLGRGERLFGVPHHDAVLIQRLLGPVGLTGVFCNGEIGPVGDRSYLHGYTAALGLFVRRAARE